jgi:hypothetical protein
MARRDIEGLARRARQRARALGGILALLLAGRISEVRFNAATGRFVLRDTSVSPAEIRRQLGTLEGRVARIMDGYAARLEAGEWTVERWHEAMAELLEESHILFGALAIGSVLGATVDATVKARAARDLKYLARWEALELRGIPPSGQALTGARGYRPPKESRRRNPRARRRRHRAYLRSMFITYAQLDQQVQVALGMKFCRRRLTAQESCTRRHALLGCVEVHAMGWMPVAEMPPIGTLRCGQFCKCYLEFRRRDPRLP